MKMTNKQKRWLRKSEAAEHIGVAERTLDKYIHDGLLHKYKIKGLVILDIRELDLLMLKSRQGA